MDSITSYTQLLTLSHDYVESGLIAFTEANKDWLVLGMTKYGFSLAISYVFGALFRCLPSQVSIKVRFSEFQYPLIIGSNHPFYCL